MFLSIFFCSLAPAFGSPNMNAEDKNSDGKGVVAQIADYNGVQYLNIKYTSDLNVCNNGGDVSPIELKIVFVMGDGATATQYEYPLSPNCPNIGTEAEFGFNSKDGLVRESWRRLGPSDPYIWDRLFPRNSDSARWYALRVYFVRSHRGIGFLPDRKDGNDYRLIFQ